MIDSGRYRRLIVGVASTTLLILGACSGGSATSNAADAGLSDGAAGAVEVVAEEAATSDAEVFDGQVHEISVEFDPTDYEAMIATYVDSSDKEWIEATVTIDGTTYPSAGIRLKGNSSLRGLDGDRGGPGAEISADAPADLPWLIKLDKYIDDQNHDGIHDFVVRSNNSETALNEAVALDLLEASGLASQDAMAVRFSINGSDQVLRLVIEHPDDVWMADTLDASGALYKADSTGDYSYRGDEPDAYDDVFDQEAGEDNADLTPLIEFLDFINNSDQSTFEAEIGDWLDVDAFATYLAMQDIVQNFDDIDGPGNNSYLYYDTETEQFTVVPWDYNLAFGDAGFGLADGQGAARGGVGDDAGRADEPSAAAAAGERTEPPGGFGPGDRSDGAAAAGGRGASNILVERLLALDEFRALYEQRVAELTTSLIDSGLAAEVVARWVEALEQDAADLVSPEIVTSEATRLVQSL